MALWLKALHWLFFQEDLGFDSQHPHGSPRRSLTPVPGDPTQTLSKFAKDESDFINFGYL